MRSFSFFRCCAVLVASLGSIQCGGDDESEGERACRDVEAKLEACNLQRPAGTACDASGSEASLCAARCLADAECDELMSVSSDNPYVRCIAGCSGAGPDDFICDSGDFFVTAPGVCNGAPDCPDGSDEAHCEGDDAGALPADAG